MEARGMRVELDVRNETMGKRIREAQLQKVPYMLVVGANEQKDGTVSIRTRAGTDGGVKTVAEMLAQFTEEIVTKKH